MGSIFDDRYLIGPRHVHKTNSYIAGLSREGHKTIEKRDGNQPFRSVSDCISLNSAAAVLVKVWNAGKDDGWCDDIVRRFRVRDHACLNLRVPGIMTTTTNVIRHCAEGPRHYAGNQTSQ